MTTSIGKVAMRGSWVLQTNLLIACRAWQLIESMGLRCRTESSIGACCDGTSVVSGTPDAGGSFTHTVTKGVQLLQMRLGSDAIGLAVHCEIHGKHPPIPGMHYVMGKHMYVVHICTPIRHQHTAQSKLAEKWWFYDMHQYAPCHVDVSRSSTTFHSGSYGRTGRLDWRSEPGWSLR